MTFSRIGAALLAALALPVFGFTSDAAAQIGTGWTQVTYTKHIQLALHGVIQTDTVPVGETLYEVTDPDGVHGPVVANYKYNAGTDAEYFNVFDVGSNRSEIRLENSYTSGHHQFQGYVRFSAPIDDDTVFQIWGSTSGSTQMMLRGYAANGGSLTSVGTPGVTLATGIYGVEQRVNVIHYQGARIELYCNGSLKGTGTDNEAVTNYWKYGCYGKANQGALNVRWRQVRTYVQ